MTQSLFDFDAPARPVVLPVAAAPAPATESAAADGPPTIAQTGDLPADFAADAFRWTSFSPEKRGEQCRREYVDAVNGLYAELWPLAKSPAQRAVLAAEMGRYRDGYLARFRAYLAAHGRTASSMITGPSNFPTRRNAKRLATCDR